jgi:O-antigen/teichoic acid export membrane protein
MAGTALVSRAVGVLTSVLAARALGPAGRGDLAQLAVIALIGAAVASAGLDLWAARVLGQHEHPSAVLHLLRRHLGTAGAALVATALVVLLVSGAPAGPVLGTVALVWATACSMVKLGLLQGADRMKAYGAASLASTAVYAVGVVLLVVLDHATVTTLLGAAVAGALATALWPGPLPTTDEGPHDAIDHVAALRSGLPAMLGGLATIALYRLDVILVGLWRSPADAGRYSVALAVAEVLWILPNSAAQAIVPRAAAPVPRVDTIRVARVLFVTMSVAAVVTVAAGWVLIPVVFGDDFAGARAALPGLAAASVAVGLWKLFSFHLLAAGDASTRVRTALLGIAVMVGVDAVTVPRWGLAGASVGALLAYLVAAVSCMRRWRADMMGAELR